MYWGLTFKISVNASYCVGILMSVVGGLQETEQFIVKFQFLFRNNRVAFIVQNWCLVCGNQRFLKYPVFHI